MSPSGLAVRFLSGPHVGAVVPVEPGRALVLGRRGAADVALDDDLVSRRHARLAWAAGELTVEDLGSANGTWLNGTQVARARLSESDRLQLGGTLLKIVAAALAPASPAPPPGGTARGAALGAGAPRRAPPPPAAAGGTRRPVDGPSVADALAALAAQRASGVLVVQRPGQAAEVKLDGGRFVACIIDGRTDVSPRKSLQRVLRWEGCAVSLRPLPAGAQAAGLGEPLAPLLANAAAEAEEFARLRRLLPARVGLRLAPGDLERADAEDRELLALVDGSGGVQELLDASRLPDLQAAQRIAALLTRGLLVSLDRAS